MFAAALIVISATSALAQQSWKKEWKKVLDAAHKEGVVVVSGPPGEAQRKAITSGWAKAYPKIKLAYTGSRGSKMVAKVVRERLAGLYNWDIILAHTNPTVFRLIPINALAPLRDALILPDIANDKNWIGGFEIGFMDSANKYFYNAMGIGQNNLGFVNRECISKNEFNKLADFKKSKFKGKIVSYDPRRPGTIGPSTLAMSIVMGEDWLKDLYENHGVTLSRSYKQMTDWLVTCKKPLVIGMPNDILEQLQKQGIGTKVNEIRGTAYSRNLNPGGAGGNETIGWYNKAPHPNAAKVFVNWYLSREFQQHYATSVKDNSRRVDTTPGDPNYKMDPKVKYFSLANEASTRKLKAMQKNMKKWKFNK
jgi:iron(III) transport system substrate-binding protein